MTLTREQIVCANDIGRPIRFHVEEWAGSVYLKILNAGERLDMAAFHGDMNEGTDFVLYLFCHTVCDEAGHLTFKYPEDCETLRGKNLDVILKVFRKAAEVNGFSQEAVENAAKN